MAIKKGDPQDIATKGLLQPDDPISPATEGLIETEAAISDITIGGTATVTLTKVYAAAGGLVTGGTATVTLTKAHLAVGGLVTGGTAISTKIAGSIRGGRGVGIRRVSKRPGYRNHYIYLGGSRKPAITISSEAAVAFVKSPQRIVEITRPVIQPIEANIGLDNLIEVLEENVDYNVDDNKIYSYSSNLDLTVKISDSAEVCFIDISSEDQKINGLLNEIVLDLSKDVHIYASDKKLTSITGSANVKFIDLGPKTFIYNTSENAISISGSSVEEYVDRIEEIKWIDEEYIVNSEITDAINKYQHLHLNNTFGYSSGMSLRISGQNLTPKIFSHDSSVELKVSGESFAEYVDRIEEIKWIDEEYMLNSDLNGHVTEDTASKLNKLFGYTAEGTIKLTGMVDIEYIDRIETIKYLDDKYILDKSAFNHDFSLNLDLSESKTFSHSSEKIFKVSGEEKVEYIDRTEEIKRMDEEYLLSESLFKSEIDTDYGLNLILSNLKEIDDINMRRIIEDNLLIFDLYKQNSEPVMKALYGNTENLSTKELEEKILEVIQTLEFM